MRHQFTTIDDVIAALIDAEPAFATEVARIDLHEIVREHKRGRVEDITRAKLNRMLADAYLTLEYNRLPADYKQVVPLGFR